MSWLKLGPFWITVDKYFVGQSVKKWPDSGGSGFCVCAKVASGRG